MLSIVAGCGLLIFARSLGSNQNWNPVNLPVPGVNQIIKYPFSVASSGRYRLEVATPITIAKDALALPEIPPIECDLSLSVENDHGFKNQQTVKLLRHSSRYEFGGLDYFVGEPIEIPRRGEYEIVISNHAIVEMLSTNGAMISLARYEKPVEWLLGWWLMDKLGYVFLLMGSIVILLCELKKP